MRKTALRALLSATIVAIANFAQAGSATWNLNPGSGDWNTAANWTPTTVPNGSPDTATFSLSNITNISTSDLTEVGGITFTPAATNPFTITFASGSRFTFSGTGIKNNSGIMQTFITGGGVLNRIEFINSASGIELPQIVKPEIRLVGSFGVGIAA